MEGYERAAVEMEMVKGLVPVDPSVVERRWCGWEGDPVGDDGQEMGWPSGGRRMENTQRSASLPLSMVRHPLSFSAPLSISSCFPLLLHSSSAFFLSLALLSLYTAAAGFLQSLPVSSPV